jgi:hypothetical protein
MGTVQFVVVVSGAVVGCTPDFHQRWFRLVPFPSSLDEQLCADMEKLSQLFCLRLADVALPVKYLGSNSFRAE